MEYRRRNLNCSLFDGQEPDLQKAICTLFDSILNVKKFYLEFEEPEKKVWFSHLERVFAYELYHQWSRILKREKLFGQSKFVLNAEIGKNTNYYGYVGEGIKFPDMVLHHNQGDNKNQGIICEIKRKEGFNLKSFRDDIEKLDCFMQKESNYKFAIGAFILVGDTIDEIYNKVASLKESMIGLRNTAKTTETQKRIVCVAYNGNTLEFSSLYHMIRNQKKHPDNLFLVERHRNIISINLNNRELCFV
jgi:hypothetical protein